jgi:hypothetical protein
VGPYPPYEPKLSHVWALEAPLEYFSKLLKLKTSWGRLSTLTRRVEGEVEVVTDPREVCKEATSFFEGWFGKGRRRWYLHGHEDVVVGGGEGVEVGGEVKGEEGWHPLWRNDVQGRELT